MGEYRQRIKRNVRSTELQTDMNDMWGGLAHWHTAVYVYVTAASALSSASFKSVWISDVPTSLSGCEPSLHSPLNPFKSCQQKERGSHGLDYDADRQMCVEQRNLKQDSFPFTFSCWPCWKSIRIPWIHEGINVDLCMENNTSLNDYDLQIWSELNWNAFQISCNTVWEIVPLGVQQFVVWAGPKMKIWVKRKTLFTSFLWSSVFINTKSSQVQLPHFP